MNPGQLETAFRTLEHVRQRGHAPSLAQALIDHASTLGNLGYFEEASSAMEEAAAIHHDMGQTIDESMCLQYAASFSRFAGDLDGAYQRVIASRDIIPSSHALHIPALMEMGEIALMSGEGLNAAQHFTDAIAYAQSQRPSEVDLKHPLDRRVRAFLLAGLAEDALADLDTVRRIVVAEGDVDAAIKFSLEQATLLHMLGHNASAQHHANEVYAWAERQNNVSALADVSLLNAALALEKGNIDQALNAALHARRYALRAVVPHLYAAAALAICELYDLMGDRYSSYEVLATGYATLTDLVGEEVSRETFYPKLIEKRDQWTVDAFETIKAEYENKRAKKTQRR